MSWVDEFHVKLIELERERDRWRNIAIGLVERPESERSYWLGVFDEFRRITGD